MYNLSNTTNTNANGLKNCLSCSRAYLGREVMCLPCLDKDEIHFKRVFDYVLCNPGSAIDEIARSTEVPSETVFRYLKQGRLKFNANAASTSCYSCQTPLSQLEKRYCTTCAKSMTRQVVRHKINNTGTTSNNTNFTSERRYDPRQYGLGKRR